MAETGKGLHRIEEDLAETWVEDWAGAGIAELEALLAKHAAFLGFLATQEKEHELSSSAEQEDSYQEAA